MPVIVTDRPNPIGGEAIDGPMLVEGFESFVGQFPIPMRHGMTIGELARFFNEACGIGADLTVVPMENWRRSMYYEDTGLPWVMPSPNMPTLDTAVVYPGTVLFEGTNVSEGRGTTRPFELIGAPWVDAEALAEHSRPTICLACTSGRSSSSRRFRSTRSRRAAAVRFTCSIATRSASSRPRSPCSWRSARRIRRSSSGGSRRTNTSTTKLPFDILPGSSELRQQIEAGLPVRRRFLTAGSQGTNGSAQHAKPFLLY